MKRGAKEGCDTVYAELRERAFGRVIDRGSLRVVVITQAASSFTTIAYVTTIGIWTTISSDAKFKPEMNTTLTDNEQVTVYGHLKRGSLNYYYIHKDGKWLLLPWLIRPTHGTPTATPDKYRSDYGRMGLSYPLADISISNAISAAYRKPDYGNGDGIQSDEHYGLDLISPSSTHDIERRKVLSATSGKVIKVLVYIDETKPHWTKGNFVAIESNLIDPANGNKLIVEYYHMLHSPLVNVGDTVSIGTELGLVGTTGNSTGEHLHFQVVRSGSWSGSTTYSFENFVNPIFFFPTTKFISKGFSTHPDWQNHIYHQNTYN